MDDLRSLPDDVLIYICSQFLQPEDLLICSLVCKWVYKVSSSDTVWVPKLSSNEQNALEEIAKVDIDQLFGSSASLRARYASAKKLPLKVRFNNFKFFVELYYSNIT
jgi:hypothetical protein